MDIQNISGRFSHVWNVEIRGITPGTPDDVILDFAMEAVGETRTRLFGWNIRRFPDGDPGYARVTLDKD